MSVDDNSHTFRAGRIGANSGPRPGQAMNPGGFDWAEIRPKPEPWMAKGICAQTDPEEFYPEKGGSTRAAKRICQGCPVKKECLDYALDRDERFGIWGGASERERRRMKRSA